MVKRGEMPRFTYFFVLFLIISAGLAIGRGTADSLFIKRFGIEYLPVMYIAMGIGMALVSLAYAAYVDRLAPEATLNILLAGLALLLVGNWYLMTRPDDAAAYPIYFILFEISSELIVMHAAFYFSANFDPEQSKRLLPMTMAGLQMGEIIGGVLLTFATKIGVTGLVLVWGALSAVALVIVVLRHRIVGASPFYLPGRRGGGLARTLDQISQGVKFIGKSALLRHSAASVMFMVIALNCVGYAMYAVFNERFQSAAELSQMLGILTIVSSTITLALQFLFTGYALTRFGVRNVNLVFPISTLLSLIGIIASFTLPAAIICLFNRRILMPAFRNPSRSLLFDALPDYMQGRGRALTLVLVLPLGYVIVGLLLRSLKTWHAPESYLAAGFVAAVLYLVFSVKTNRAYVQALVSTLKERLFLPAEGLRTLGGTQDPELFAHLVEGVRHTDAQVCLTYTRKIVAAFPEQATGIILERMQSAATPLRDALIRLLAPQLTPALFAQMEVEVRNGDAHERATILALRFEARDPGALPQVDHCLASDNPRMLVCGVLGVARFGIESMHGAAMAQWRELLDSEEKERIAAALYLARSLAAPAAFAPRLCILLDHADVTIQLGALLALQTGAPGPAPDLAPALARLAGSRDRDLRCAAIHCSRRLDDAARDHLCMTALADPHPRVAQAALDLLEEVHESVPARIFAWLEESRVAPRQQRAVLAYLSQRGIARQWFEEFAARKLAAATLLSQSVFLLQLTPGGEAAVELLRIVMNERVHQLIDIALQAMESVGDREAVRIVHAALSSKDARQVARARETLAYVTHLGLATQLGGLLTGTVGALSKSHAPASLAELLAWCETHADDWLKACARRALSTTAQPDATGATG